MLIHLLVLLQPFELVPVLFQHRCLHLNNGCEIPELELYFTWSFLSLAREPQLIMLSRVMSAISSRLLAAMSRLTVPFKRRDRSSKREWREREGAEAAEGQLGRGGGGDGQGGRGQNLIRWVQ